MDIRASFPQHQMLLGFFFSVPAHLTDNQLSFGICAMELWVCHIMFAKDLISLHLNMLGKYNIFQGVALNRKFQSFVKPKQAASEN